MGYRTNIGEKATTAKWKKLRMTFHFSQYVALTSWRINDYEEDEGSAQNCTGGPGQ